MAETRLRLVLYLPLVFVCCGCNETPAPPPTVRIVKPQIVRTETNPAQKFVNRLDALGAMVWFGDHPELSATDSVPRHPTQQQWNAIPDGVTALQVSVRSVTDIADLHVLKDLDQLILDCRSLEDGAAIRLPPLVALRILSIDPPDSFTGDKLRYLAVLPNLEELRLGFAQQLRADHFAHLQEVTSLRKLSVSGGPITDRTLEHLGRLTQLEVLRLGNWGMSDNIKSESLKGLSPLNETLKRLHFDVSDSELGDELVDELRVVMPNCEITRGHYLR